MPTYNKLLFATGLIFILGINPWTCAKGCRGCGRAADDVAKHGDDVRYTDKVTYNVPPVDDPTLARTGEYSKNLDGTYTYNNRTYSKFDDIPFHSTDYVYAERSLSSDEAAHLMNKGVNFVFNKSAYARQAEKNFKILYLISEDVSAVKNLYQLDNRGARNLINYSSELLENNQIIKVSSYEEMIAKQNEVLYSDEVPVLIFHNSEASQSYSFKSETNFITCNSFSINPESYLTSTTLLDMKGIIKSLNSSYQNQNLEDFYRSFSAQYNSYMTTKRKLRTLIYIGGGIGVAGGVAAVAYYNSNESDISNE